MENMKTIFLECIFHDQDNDDEGKLTANINNKTK